MPRAAALDLLNAVLHHKRLLDDAQHGSDAMARCAERDRALALRIARTVLRHLGEIDAVIEAFVDRPMAQKGGKKGQAAHDVVRIGLAQLLFMDMAPHAAVDTAVELCRGAALAPYRKLVNAVLRRAGREGAAVLDTLDGPRLNTPTWLYTRWQDHYGPDLAYEIARIHMLEPPLDLTAKTDPAAWIEPLNARLMPTGSLRLAPRTSVTTLPGFAEGAWWVQDMAASLPARLLGNVNDMDVIDLCCAPGGKTMELAAAGARVRGIDRSENRIKRVRQNLERTGLDATLITADAETWRPAMLADAVLLDAPCSATGTARRHPDVVRLKKPDDVTKLSGVQARLLRAALDMVRPGGLIVYCTCSLEPEEGEHQIAALLNDGAPAERVPISPGEAGALGDVVTDAGDLRTLPCHLADQGGMDGFYAARLRRT